jgi:Lipocalin-like domain
MLRMSRLMTAFSLVALLQIGDVAAQQPKIGKAIVGAWTIVSVDTVRSDGTRVPTFGPNPKGLAIFDPSGRYSLHLARSNTAPFASKNRMEGTPEENKAVVQGTLSHIGTYVVSEAESTLVLHMESSSFPNWNGTEQRRVFTLAGDELRWRTPVASGGGSTELVWKRAN